MRRILGMFLLAVWVLGIAGSSLAATECPICNASASDSYLVKTTGQFSRGAANLAFGWLEIPNRLALEVNKGGNALIGVGKGFGQAFLRTLRGAGELITAPMPRYKDGSYTQISKDCTLGLMRVTNR